MKYKTTIEVESEAKTKKEAMEIVDDYLAGNLVTGISMRCNTRPVRAYAKSAITITVVSVLIAVGVLSMIHVNPSSKAISISPAASTVQPVLKTQSKEKPSSDFRKEWEDRETREALRSIKKLD